MRRVVVGALAAAATIAAAAAAAAPAPVVVTRDSIDLPAGCSPRQVAGLLLRFASAFDDGDRAELERLFAPAGARPPSFRWFTTGDVRILRRRDLVPQLLALRARGERLRIRDLDVGRSRVAGSVAIGLSLLRTTAGGTRAAHGKAEIECAHGRFYVWSTGDGDARFCADAPGVDPARAVVACSRRGRAPHAQEVTEDFRVAATPVALPTRCRPNVVGERLVHVVRAFNLGATAAFARDFTARAVMQPYTGSAPFVQLIGRDAIARFAGDRDERGDGWTVSAVDPPTGSAGLPREAVYLLHVRVSARGAAFGAGGAKVVIACRSGLIVKWVGPGTAAP
jgi:hypothetical protein